MKKFNQNLVFYEFSLTELTLFGFKTTVRNKNT